MVNSGMGGVSVLQFKKAVAESGIVGMKENEPVPKEDVPLPVTPAQREQNLRTSIQSYLNRYERETRIGTRSQRPPPGNDGRRSLSTLGSPDG